MKKALLGAMLLIAALAGTARAEHYGLEDSHHVWHDADYWHERHPEWVYRYHPEWAMERQEWWEADHRQHPEWFGSPYWQQYPVWTWGDYDEHHVWHYAGWWHDRNPAWFYAHHPGWAEGHPEWMRRDHAGHPEWFRSPYWEEHRHDWNHPDEAYRHTLDRSIAYQKEHQEMRLEHPHEFGPNPHGEAFGRRGPQEHAFGNNPGFHPAPSQPHQGFGGGANPPSFHPAAPSTVQNRPASGSVVSHHH